MFKLDRALLKFIASILITIIGCGLFAFAKPPLQYIGTVYLIYAFIESLREYKRLRKVK